MTHDSSGANFLITPTSRIHGARLSAVSESTLDGVAISPSSSRPSSPRLSFAMFGQAEAPLSELLPIEFSQPHLAPTYALLGRSISDDLLDDVEERWLDPFGNLDRMVVQCQSCERWMILYGIRGTGAGFAGICGCPADPLTPGFSPLVRVTVMFRSVVSGHKTGGFDFNLDRVDKVDQKSWIGGEQIGCPTSTSPPSHGSLPDVASAAHSGSVPLPSLGSANKGMMRSSCRHCSRTDQPLIFQFCEQCYIELSCLGGESDDSGQDEVYEDSDDEALALLGVRGSKRKRLLEDRIADTNSKRMQLQQDEDIERFHLSPRTRPRTDFFQLSPRGQHRKRKRNTLSPSLSPNRRRAEPMQSSSQSASSSSSNLCAVSTPEVMGSETSAAPVRVRLSDDTLQWKAFESKD